MYAILGQDRNGLHWLANADDLDGAKTEYEARDTDSLNVYDAILVVPLSMFADVDGWKPERAPLITTEGL